MPVINSYEAVIIFSVKDGEEVSAALVEKFKTLIEQNATITTVDEWGKRRLAYLINDEAEGLYVLVKFQCGPEFPSELDRVLKITDGILRSLIIKLEPEDEKDA